MFVAFPVTTIGGYSGEASTDQLIEALHASVVIWTTTPWTIPGNRAIAFSPKIAYGLYRVTASPNGNWAKVGQTYLLADALAASVFKAAKVEAYERVANVSADTLAGAECAHPLAGFAGGYDFRVPLLAGDHVTDDAGTGFVHTAPGHGREDFDLWMANHKQIERIVSDSYDAETGVTTKQTIDTRIPYTIDEDSRFTADAPGFEGARVLDDKGNKGDANNAVIAALIEAGHLVARGKLKHQYPHSWRSKKPVIFRNTPQWFIAMDSGIDLSPRLRGEGGRRPDEGQPLAPHLSPLPAGGEREGPTLRAIALDEIAHHVQWVPPSGETRITGMIANRPDWVVSRQRAWGVPIALFVRRGEHTPLVDERVNARIVAAFEAEGADAWFAQGAAARFLGNDYDPGDYEKIDDVLDVWFDSGSTHAFTLEDAQRFPGLADIRRIRDGGADAIMYLEGSDQHRGWFHSSLLESSATRGRAPFDIVLTHGFTLDENGRKMSKSLGNTVEPAKVIAEAGADILRLWVASVDYWDDQRIGPEILKGLTDTYRKLRNTLRWMLGALAHHDGAPLDLAQAEELERLMLHRLAMLGGEVQAAYAAFDYKRVVARVSAFMNADLSAFYFDIRKDALYCDPPSSARRRTALATIAEIFRCVTTWLAPILSFTTEEAWLDRHPDAVSIHLELLATPPEDWRDDALAARWETIRHARAAVTGALEIARAEKRIGSSLEAAPVVHVADSTLRDLLASVPFADLCITSDITLAAGEGPAHAFRLPDLPGVSVVVERARGIKCARSWRWFNPATAEPGFPDVTPRDAQALRELRATTA